MYQDILRLKQARRDSLAAAKLLSDKGRLTAAEKREFDRAMHEAADFKRQYEAIEAGEMASFRGGAVDGGGRQQTTRERDHADAFRSFLRFGRAEMSDEHRRFLDENFRAQIERRDMGEGGGNSLVGTGGAYLVPISFSNAIEEALKFDGNLAKFATVHPTDSGAPLPWPLADDTQTLGELVGESQQATSVDVNLGNVVFGASTRLVKCSLELLADSAFDIETWLIGVFATRLSRILNAHFTTGTGSSQPKGLVTAALAAGNTVAAVGSSGNTGADDGTNTVGSADIFNLIHAVDPLYRQDPSCAFMMHDLTKKRIAQTLDKFGRPLFQPNLMSGMLDSIAGYPICLNNSMDVLKAMLALRP